MRDKNISKKIEQPPQEKVTTEININPIVEYKDQKIELDKKLGLEIARVEKQSKLSEDLIGDKISQLENLQ